MSKLDTTVAVTRDGALRGQTLDGKVKAAVAAGPAEIPIGEAAASVRAVVEDGHHFWRSYFYFNGKYSVHPMYIPIYQDAVLDETYGKTLKAQFIQLRRWMYGASDIPYIASHVFTKRRTVPFWPSFVWFIRALDGYVTAASVSIIVAIGGWVPLLLNSDAYRDVVAQQLPDAISIIQRIALVGLIVMVFMSFKLLPPRPARRSRPPGWPPRGRVGGSSRRRP